MNSLYLPRILNSSSLAQSPNRPFEGYTSGMMPRRAFWRMIGTGLENVSNPARP